MTQATAAVAPSSATAATAIPTETAAPAVPAAPAGQDGKPTEPAKESPAELKARLLERAAARFKSSAEKLRAGASASGQTASGAPTSTTPAASSPSVAPARKDATPGNAASSPSATPSGDKQEPAVGAASPPSKKGESKDVVAERLARAAAIEEKAKRELAAAQPDIELGRSIREARTKGDRIALIKQAIGDGVDMEEILLDVATAAGDKKQLTPQEIAAAEAKRVLKEQQEAAEAEAKKKQDEAQGTLDRQEAETYATDYLSQRLQHVPQERRIQYKAAALAVWNEVAAEVNADDGTKYPGIKKFGILREWVDKSIWEMSAKEGRALSVAEALKAREDELKADIRSHQYAREVESVQGGTAKPAPTVTSSWQRGAVPAPEEGPPLTLEEKKAALLRSKGWRK